MTLASPIAFARAQAQTDSNGLTDANAIVFANEALVDFHRRLVNAGVDASQVEEAYRDGTVGTGTYLYPDNMLFLKAIDLNYSNANQQDYKTANQLDVSNIPGNVSFQKLRVDADPGNPWFDDRGDWFEIFPTPTASHNVSQLIRLIYYIKPTLYTATSDTVAYPESMDAAILGWRMASSYLYSLGKIDQGVAFNNKYEERVRNYIATLSRGTQQPLQAIPIQITGWEF